MPRDPDKPPGYYCDATTKHGLCGQRAGHATRHVGIGRCSRHGGSTPSHVASAREQQAIDACTKLAIRLDLDPAEALLRGVADAAGMAEWYRARVMELAPHPENGKVMREFVAGPPAIYAPTFHVSGIATGEAKPHILVRLWAEERDRRDRAAKMALDAGVAQRLVDLAEDTARRLAAAFTAFALAMGLDLDSSEVKQAMRASIAASGDVVGGTATEIPA